MIIHCTTCLPNVHPPVLYAYSCTVFNFGLVLFKFLSISAGCLAVKRN